jgi:hypothetical protein
MQNIRPNDTDLPLIFSQGRRGFLNDFIFRYKNFLKKLNNFQPLTIRNRKLFLARKTFRNRATKEVALNYERRRQI